MAEDGIVLPAEDPEYTGPQWVRLVCPKCVVILTRAEFVEGLRRGKAVKRRQAMEPRLSRDKDEVNT